MCTFLNLSKTYWNHLQPDPIFTDMFHFETNNIFSTFLLGIQRLEDQGKIPLAHHAMIEDMLTFWTAMDSYVIELQRIYDTYK